MICLKSNVKHNETKAEPGTTQRRLFNRVPRRASIVNYAFSTATCCSFHQDLSTVYICISAARFLSWQPTPPDQPSMEPAAPARHSPVKALSVLSVLRVRTAGLVKVNDWSRTMGPAEAHLRGQSHRLLEYPTRCAGCRAAHSAELGHTWSIQGDDGRGSINKHEQLQLEFPSRIFYVRAGFCLHAKNA